MNPDIQKAAGEPLLIHFPMKFTLSRRSLIQEARGLRERKPVSAHRSGT